MRIGILAILTGLIAGSSALAQQTQLPTAGTAENLPGQHGQQSTSESDRQTTRRDQLAARLDALKESLHLTVDQQKNWGAYEGALQSVVNTRRQMRDLFLQPTETTDPTQILRQRAEALGNLSSALSRLASAQEPLYNSLDQSQKRQFTDNAPTPRMMGPGREEPRLRRPDRDEDRVSRWRDRDRNDDRSSRWHDRDRDENRSGRWRDRDRDEDRSGRWDDRDKDDYQHSSRRHDDCDRRPWRCDRDDEDRDRNRGYHHHHRWHDDEDDRYGGRPLHRDEYRGRC